MKLNPEDVSLDQLRQLWSGAEAQLGDASMQRVANAAASVDRIVASGETVYGVNTGFGMLAIRASRTSGSPNSRPISFCRTVPVSAIRCRGTSRD